MISPTNPICADRDDGADHQGDQGEQGDAEAVDVQAEGRGGFLPGRQEVERTADAEEDGRPEQDRTDGDPHHGLRTRGYTRRFPGRHLLAVASHDRFRSQCS